MPSYISEAPDETAGDAAAVATALRMRRVASAPAFKHASAYQGPCAALAEAQVQAQAEAAAAARGSSSSASTSSMAAPEKRRFFSGWGSGAAKRAPQANTNCGICPGGRCNCLEVYVVSRAFTEFGGDLVRNLPSEAREHMIDLGLCHYMTVFKTPDGQLVQFDFGPRGGDVQKAHGPLATFLRRAHAAALAQTQQQQMQLAVAGAGAAASSSGGSGSRGMVQSPSMPVLPLASVDLAGQAGEAATAAFHGQAPPQQRKKGVAGEIRERTLDSLPSACMYMGRTNLSLADIRRYNRAQVNMQYTLHDNDCRHYVNSLVQYATGVERSTQHLKRHYFNTRHADKWLWYGWFISATQLVTDVGNWGHVQAGAAVTLLAVTGRSTLAQLKTLALPVMPALSKSLPSLIPAGAAAGGAASGAGSGVAGGLATTLKLPAALLLKRPLAVTAAGGAGAAAAAVRTVPGVTSDAAAASSGTGGSSSSHGSRGFGGFGSWARPFKQWRDGMGRSIHGAVLSLRRAAVGNSVNVEQLNPARPMEAAAAAAAAASSSRAIPVTVGSSSSFTQPPRRGWFGRNSNRQLMVQAAGSGAVVAAAPTAVVALPNTPTSAPSRWSGSSGRNSSSGSAETEAPRRERGNFFLGLGQQVGRHVKWLGHTAATATGTIAVLASKQVGYIVGARNNATTAAAAAAAALGGSGMSQSNVALNMLRQHAGQQQQSQQQRGLMGQRSKSAPSLAVVAAAAAAAPGNGPGQTGATAVTSDSACQGGDMLDSVIFVSSGSSSVTCSSLGGRPSGVGRQVLNLPAPRISWGKRASHAVIVGQ